MGDQTGPEAMTNDVIRVHQDPCALDGAAWNALLDRQSRPTPFMRWEYLAALHASGSAIARTGWSPRFVTVERAGQLVAAAPAYLKSHSYGEYVFDWAWASAYEQHGVPYYPKAVIAVPFTPVPGSRLLARDAATRALLVQAVCQWCEQENVSSVHVLFASDDDVQTSVQQDLMLRHTVQFHWKNEPPTLVAAQGEAAKDGQTPRYRDFDHFLASLSQDKRKKIRQERRRVSDAGVTFRWSRGTDISEADWDFFYRCYERTYLEHGNPPYLTRDFFARMAAHMPEAWLLFVGERDGRPIASSLIAIGAYESSATVPDDSDSGSEPGTGLVAYGRYWGALERVDCLHFEACYYQPLRWCIAHGAVRFEGGAQGEHKMARALLPVQATSAHWLEHPTFAEAVQRFLEREGAGVENYLESLHQRLPFKQAP